MATATIYVVAVVRDGKVSCGTADAPPPGRLANEVFVLASFPSVSAAVAFGKTPECKEAVGNLLRRLRKGKLVGDARTIAGSLYL